MFVAPVAVGRLCSWWISLLCTVTLWVVRPAFAEPVASLVAGGPVTDVPRELLPWVPWVRESVTEGLCPKLGEAETCLWPSTLAIHVAADGADFTFAVFLEVDGWVTLPGSAAHWPEFVQADGERAVVLSKSGAPAIRLLRGPHRLQGRFVWNVAPETLTMPRDVGLVELTVRNQAVAFPRREESGALWLQAGTTSNEDAADRAEVEVFRRLEDGVPLEVKTQILLHVSGRPREIRLIGAALPKSQILSIEAPIPVKTEADGTLILHASAGEHRITSTAIYPTPPEQIQLPNQAPPWPTTEIWVFVPNNAIRQVDLTGAPGIDAAQTNLPEDWKAHQAFSMSRSKTITFETKRRGEPEPPPNQLTVVRNLWLDFDGRGYTVQDHLTGTLNRDTRLDLATTSLGHVAVGSKDLLVTRSKSGEYGVEVRQPKLDVQAEWRLEDATTNLPAVAWKADVNSLRATLNLPPGWELLHATGVDSATDTWWSEWSLWGFFYVLLVVIAIGRLFGPPAAALAALTLGVTYGRQDNPMAFWSILLALLALLRLVPAGWFRRVLRVSWWGTVLIFAMVGVGFAIGEVRGAFFPAARAPVPSPLARGEKGQAMIALPKSEPQDEQDIANAPMALQQQAPPVPPVQTKSEDVSKNKFASGTGRLARKRLVSGIGSGSDEDIAWGDNEAVVQTGPGLPGWHWKTVELGWSGPVRQDQGVHFYLVGPVTNKLLAVLRVLGMALLGALLIRRTPFGLHPPDSSTLLRRASAVALFLGTLIGIVTVPQPARAEPSAVLLNELKTRLTRGPDCDGCMEVESLRLGISRHSLEATAVVHVGRIMDYRVPGPVRSWSPEKVLVDGKPASAMLLGSDGFLHVRMSEGQHEVAVVGPVVGDELVISPGSTPHRVQVAADGWLVDGLRDGRVETSLHFTAENRPNQKGAPAEAADTSRQRLPAWLEITRVLELGVTWRVTTEVTRKSAKGEPVSVRYALLPGEEVTTSNAIVEQGQLVLTLGRDDDSASYQSVLKSSDAIKLTAALERPWSEHWQVRCGALWSCEFDGVAPYTRNDASGYAPQFRPWPGESVTVAVTRPPAAPGESHTIERIEADLTPGQRLLSGSLELTFKVSKAYTPQIRLSPNAVVQQLTINGHDEPIRMLGDSVEFALQPGHWDVQVRWHEARPQALVFQTPRIEVGTGAVNASVKVHLPKERWLLLTWGPSWGPKVLLWSYLLLLLGAAFILVRIGHNPLKLWQWLLLGIGLAQAPSFATLLIAAWFFLLTLRSKASELRRWQKNLMQIGLAIHTLVFLSCLGTAVYDGLVSNPDMLINGHSSSGDLELTWYEDRITGALPTITVFSAPVIVFKLLNLLWALWLASNLLGWLRWGWNAYAKDGLWAAKPVKQRATAECGASAEASTGNPP